ncbi:hypothetical protein DSL72_005911 [Monilinia vaccinii-corymbosi]|uniref:Uncharacterized protein n=1 Tax=Monilinia vaccinii-corymbosi TaxID=61207 RepID=A0A8A3PGY1_9HELO|nr:hypothetical protein DSL72_005911 [Monilinia vaccinii-corymbosi]
MSRNQDPQYESHASRVDSLNRIELRPSRANSLCILFKPEETLTAVKKWIIVNRLDPRNVDLVPITEYLHSITGGHPGMVGLILGFFETSTSRETRRWTPALCHEFIAKYDLLIAYLTRWGRGVWTFSGENHLKRVLIRYPSYSHLKYSDIVGAMRKVATLPEGYTEEQ